MAMLDDQFNEYQSPHEPKHHWQLKKKFMMKHQGQLYLL